MRISRRAAATSVAACILAVGSAVPAFAETAYVGGGTWNYGENSSIVWSDYYHPRNCHGSSVQGKWFDSDTASAGQWSRAWAESRWYAVDKSYYRSYC